MAGIINILCPSMTTGISIFNSISKCIYTFLKILLHIHRDARPHETYSIVFFTKRTYGF